MPTHLYSPLDPAYFDTDDARTERDRTFQICSDCRLCVRLCPSFKDLFRLIDTHEGLHPARELTDDEHKVVVDECYQCKLCYVVCPYTPDQDQVWKVDFPRLMMRSLAIQARAGKVGHAARLLARTDLQGQLATVVAPVVNATGNVRFLRGVMEKVTGIAADRKLPQYARERFSKWFARRAPSDAAPSRGPVALFPTCLVEYQEPAIGRAVVEVCEHNGMACELPAGQVCCGMPWLDAGDVDRFKDAARRNVAALAPAAKIGHTIVVPQPTCAYVLKHDYPDVLGTDDARLVAAQTRDVAEHLMSEHASEPLADDFTGDTYRSITWHAACHYRAQQIGPKSKDLMELTGARVSVVERCSAIDGTWGLRAENVEMARAIAKPLMDAVRNADSDLVAGDCHLSNTAVAEATAKFPVHPVQVLARAYGFEEG